jgi:hypothetical protein
MPPFLLVNVLHNSTTLLRDSLHGLFSICSIDQAWIPDLVANLKPLACGAQCRHRPDFAKDEINDGRHDEAGEEVQPVDVSGSNRYRGSNGTCEAYHVDHDSAEVGNL